MYHIAVECLQYFIDFFIFYIMSSEFKLVLNTYMWSFKCIAIS